MFAAGHQSTLLARALLLDLEVTPTGRIREWGAVLGDRTLKRSGDAAAVAQDPALRALAADAVCVLGHNLVRHDLRILREQRPGHCLLQLPVVDTLVLSPIAFPENPYHRLVKDYKLVRESVSDPVADARLAAVLFRDEWDALAGLRRTEPGLWALLRFLLGEPSEPGDRLAAGLEAVFSEIGRGERRLSREDAAAWCREHVRRYGCAEASIDDALWRSASGRHALTYATSWLRVAGSNSVLPPWVRMEHPAVGELIRRWREEPCAAAACAYCRRVHNAPEQLRVFFGFDGFRPLPASGSGGSLQRDIVEAGMRGESLLALLPTGGGKSLCYQLPALVRHHRRGVLTVVISPLQALMKDQVDGLVRRTGTPHAAALYGLLTPPERGDVLRRIRLGDVALLYVSPEQFRNRSFREAIAHREIGCWVFDEAHCLSKWGHDFRPDYLYAGRFIREFSAGQGVPVAPIACFTATAKTDVRREIVEFFRTETDRGLALYEGGVERENLRFAVQTIGTHAKLERIHDLLADRLGFEGGGSAIVFRSRRHLTEETAAFLSSKGWAAAHFHAGLTPAEKKRIQDEFLSGSLRVMCATNAFGMGIDKEDVRLVIHADTPGSLENYLQEAGRAGRDGGRAECVLLYDESDCEEQFRLSAMSELSRRDIAQILRVLRNPRRQHDGRVVITTGEILRDEDLDVEFEVEGSMADTRVRTAVAWLERAGFVQRDENVTQVFQARLLVRTMAEAEQRIGRLGLSPGERALWLAVLREMMNAQPSAPISVDQLAQLPEFMGFALGAAPAADGTDALREEPPGAGRRWSPEYVSAKVLKVLRSMCQADLLQRDTLFSAYVRHKVANPSRLALERVSALDRALIDLLAREEPDPEGWMPLSLRRLNQRLTDEGFESTVDGVRRLLQSLGEDGRGFAGSHGSIELKFFGRDAYRVRVRRPWQQTAELAEKRRRVAKVALEAILGKVPADAPASAERLVPFTLEELRQAVEGDLVLRSEVKEMDAALERALMFMHELGVIVLHQGLAVFRSAMTIRVEPEMRGVSYATGDYRPLRDHYRERVFQIHVMSEYARCGLERVSEALKLVLAYFTMDKAAFIRRFMHTKPDLLTHATTAQSFQRIVTDLGNREQQRVVTAPLGKNLLILAGPGSGKTRTVVHRCAYLLRVERVRPASVLVCCFNRQAAIEIRRRLRDLVGTDAHGVTVATYHGLAMRLLGRSLGGGWARGDELPDFNGWIVEAAQLLGGEQAAAAGVEPDEVRDRVLAGFQHILVDEYQDIDEPQYELISAIAGRTLHDADARLSVLAVGDDDQNIYAFRGANVEFIRRFEKDYDAEVHYLVENYRSTGHIIAAANALIAANRDRMKRDRPIRVDRRRARAPAGGEGARLDPVTGGRVQVIEVPDAAGQARAVVAEIERLRQWGVEDPAQIAVLARSHRELVEVRAAAEEARVPVRWLADPRVIPPLHRVREIHAFLADLAGRRGACVRAEALLEQAAAASPAGDAANPWRRFLVRTLEAWREETENAELPAGEAMEAIYEACAEARRGFAFGDGVWLSTVHAAKGTEHDHVLLIGAWPLDGSGAAAEELRRVFYVGMTRARKTLAVVERADVPRSVTAALTGRSVVRTLARAREDAGSQGRSTHPGPACCQYAPLGLDSVHLGYAGQFPAGHPVHRALARMQPGDRVIPKPDSGGIALQDGRKVAVARLSRKAVAEWRDRIEGGQVRAVRVLGLVRRSAEQEGEHPEGKEQAFQVAEWEVPLLEIVAEEKSPPRGGR